jgi:hypothetical protein
MQHYKSDWCDSLPYKKCRKHVVIEGLSLILLTLFINTILINNV